MPGADRETGQRVAFATLGCKVNQYETAGLRADAENAGLVEVPFGSEADVYVVNTCTVTAKADAESRRLVRSAGRRNPGARILVTGCYATRAGDDLKALSGVEAVCGNQAKQNLMQRFITNGPTHCKHANKSSLEVWAGKGFSTSRSRAYLRIQDGCDNRCSYCIVPAVRGPSRSVSAGNLVAAARRAEEDGFREIVVTGIHIGFYGRDLGDGSGLGSLVNGLLEGTNDLRFRLSSLEATELTEELLELVAEHPRVCRHLHLPLQSGSDRILGAMKRHYGRKDYVDVLGRVRGRSADICVGADVITGFPGESDAEFEESVRIAEGEGLNYLHAFSYSPRAGTPAADLPGQVPGSVKRERTGRLREISSTNLGAFALSAVGKSATAIVERGTKEKEWSVLTDNYLRLTAKGDCGGRRTLVRVRIDAAHSGRILS